MPASGKSFCGALLAKKLHRPLVDLDDYIQQITGKSIAEIFADGETYFRQLEQEALHHLLSHTQLPSVLSMGGGTVAYSNNVEVMQQNGQILYLDVPIPELIRRMQKEPEIRPLWQYSKNLQQDLQQIYKQRAPYFNKADWRIENCERATLDNFVQMYQHYLLLNHG